MVRRFSLLFIFFGISLIGLGWHLWHVNLPLISPLDVITSFTQPLPFKNGRAQKIVYGFLPYWNMKYSDQIPIKYLTHLAYFGVDLNPNGSLKTREDTGEIEPGLYKLDSSEFSILHRQLKLTGKKSILLVRAFDPDQIESIINNQHNWQTAIREIMTLATTKQFDGLNIDFEYVGTPDQRTKDNFSQFIDSLAWTCRIQLPGCEISLDVFADSAAKNRLWDLPRLSASVDQIIVMTYDFYRSSSAQAGPVAPLRGACGEGFIDQPNCLDYDVTLSMADTLKKVPANKILMGIPFYGYEWQTAGRSFLANTYPDTGATATYKRIQELLSAPDQVSSVSAQWNNETMTPYVVYQDRGATYQVHYEDPRSLGLKLDLVNQTGIGGVAIWALGYEVPYQELWQTIATKVYH
jgi:spore germination protein YaaH